MSLVRSNPRRWPGAVLLAALVILLPSCQKKSNRLPVFPVKGQVLVDGKPAKGVFVYLWPGEIAKTRDAYCPNGQTDESGRFNLSTYNSDDGAPAGDYVVTLEWPIRYNALSAQWEGDQFKGKYSDHKKSTMRATVKSEPTELEPIKVVK